MRFEILIQFIVPLTFLAIWALTTLLNRDAQPLPPRPGRSPGSRPVGPIPALDRRPAQPGDALAGQSVQPRSLERLAPRGMPPAPGSGSRGRDGDRPLLSRSDAIVFLENEAATRPPQPGGMRSLSSGSGSPGGGRSPQRVGGSRRGSRSRASVPGTNAPSRGDSQPQRALSDQLHESLALQRAKPLEIAPLGAPMKRLARPLTQASATAEVALDRGAPAAVSLNADQIRGLIANPDRLREIAVLTEILGPPRALRRRR